MEIRRYQVEFKIEKDNTLFLLQNAVWTKVVLKPCFPKTHPTKYFSVMDDKDKEIRLLETLETLDYDKHARFIIQRVIQRGSLNDWVTIKKYYGIETLTKEILQIRDLDALTFNFFSSYFGLEKSKFRCYTTQQLQKGHFNY